MVTTYDNHTCESFSDNVIQYLDGRLNQQQQQDLLTEMKSCPSCSAKYNQEKAIRALIRSKVTRKKVSPTFIQSIKDKIGHPSI